VNPPKTTSKPSQPLLATLLLAGAAVISWGLLKTAPKTVPEEKQRGLKIAQYVEISPGTQPILVTAWGNVVPSQEITVRAQVSGQTLSIHPNLVPGGKIESGKTLLEIDPSDYRHNLAAMKAGLDNARADMEMEMGQQAIAKREWERLQKEIPHADTNPDLALRKPHLHKVQAELAKAENALARAELDVARTTIAAPFNCMVVSESAEAGQLVESGKDVCRIVGTDTFWIRATVKVSDLDKLDLPTNGKDGAKAKVTLDTGATGHSPEWEGRVIRLLGDLEPNSRMARVLVEVEDPLGLKDPGGTQLPLLLGSYAKVQIDAGALHDVLKIPRPALREGNQLWLVGQDNRIRIAPADILWSQGESIFVSNVLKDGERLVLSGLRSALPGMEVNPQPAEVEKGAKGK
jgi:RND family efflux transporter MFP subunit